MSFYDLSHIYLILGVILFYLTSEKFVVNYINPRKSFFFDQHSKAQDIQFTLPFKNHKKAKSLLVC